MRYTIRRNTFETNSSSMHSVIVMSGNKKEEYNDESNFYVHDGAINFYENELYFGRSPFEILNTIRDKTRYVIASLLGSYNTFDKNIEDEIISALQKVDPSITTIKYPTDLEDYYVGTSGNRYNYWDSLIETDGDKFYAVRQDGTRERVNPKRERITTYGDVDHQSCGLLKEALREEGISIEEFILNPNYIVVIDGDEYCEWDSMKKSGLVDLSKIKKEY